MNLVRTLRVLRHQWWLILLVALVGAGVALVTAELRNRNLEPSFEAVAPVTVLRLPEENDDPFERRVATVVSQARSSVADRLVDSSFRVEEGEAGGVVHFVAIARDSETALAEATGLRRAYLGARPAGTAEQQLGPVLESLISEIQDVEQQLTTLRGSATADSVTDVERSALESALASATQEAASLEVQLLDPDLAEEERIEAQERLETVEALIDTIGARLEDLPRPESTVPDSETRMEILVLERRLRDLESQYVASALQQGEPGAEGLLGEPYVTDQSPQKTSLALAAVAGLIAGGLVSGIGLVGSDRLRQPIRSAEEVSRLPVIEVDRRQPKPSTGVSWYLEAGKSPRRAHIQSLRTNLDRFPGSATFLVTGLQGLDREVTDLSTDLAASIAATGRKSLMIDTNFDRPVAMTDSFASLADILSSQRDSIPDPTLIKRLLGERSETVPNLLLVPAGSITTDPIDALASAVFGRILHEARELADIVLVTAPAVGTAGADAVALHAQHAIVAIERNRTGRDQLLDSVSHLEKIGVSVLSIALLGNGTRFSRGKRTHPTTAHSRSQSQRRVRRKRSRKATG